MAKKKKKREMEIHIHSYQNVCLLNYKWYQAGGFPSELEDKKNFKRKKKAATQKK